jgi:hypothetical protein
VNARRDAAPQEPPGLGFAWRVHSAQDASTGRVDTKASIILTLETALLLAGFAAEAPHRLVGNLSGRFALVAYIGIVLLILAVVLAALAVIPWLGLERTNRRDYVRNAVYFGHLRHWYRDQQRLADYLRRLDHDEQLEQLAREIATLGRLNWRKHRLLQLSMVCAFLGAAVIGLAVLLGR